MAMSPRTHKVLLKDGTQARAVRLSASNNLKVLNWIPDAVHKEYVSASGQVSRQHITLPINGTKTLRAAYYDDWIVKTDKGFGVVKFDKVENTLFFPNSMAWSDEKQVAKAFKAWAAA